MSSRLRQGRAIKWFEEALEPLRTEAPQVDIHRLALAIRTATGIEALVSLTDIAGLSREEAAELMRWSARALLRSAIAKSRLDRPHEHSGLCDGQIQFRDVVHRTAGGR